MNKDQTQEQYHIQQTTNSIYGLEQFIVWMKTKYYRLVLLTDNDA